MEHEDRKKKLAAGKEKLAAFRKKRAKKKKAESDAGVSMDSTQNSANGTGDGSLANVSSLSDLNSITGESDQYSLTSGDEWSAEESDLQAAVHYQTKLTAATQRIAELEEAVEGKQLALDRMVLEMQLSDSSPHEVPEGRLSGGDISNSVKGSMLELQGALEQRDKIIRQLTTRLQETVASKSSDTCDDRPDYMQETQNLSQQVVLLQKQLTQAGETVEQQVAMCQMSVRALQEAKTQILALQGKVTEKNNLLQQLSYSLTTRSSEVTTLKQREAELEQLVQVLKEQAPKGDGSDLEASQSAASRVVSLEQELERLSTEHAQSSETVAELQQLLALSESARQSLINEKEEAVKKIAGLEEELDQLGQVKDDALKKMLDLECQVREGSTLLQAECDSQSREASERIAELEKEIVELNDEHRVHLDQLNQRRASLEARLAESANPSQGDLSDLKNVINSQQGELLSLHQQLESLQGELSSSKEQAASLQHQLDQLQNNHRSEQEEAAGIVHSLQLEVQTLREENTRYQQQMAHAQEQVQSFKDSLQLTSFFPASDDVNQGEAIPSENYKNLDKLDAESDLSGQIQLLQKSYAHLLTQYTQMLEENHQLRVEAQSIKDSEETGKEQSATVQHLTAEVSRLQAEVDRWEAHVQEKDCEMGQLNSQLQALVKEKESLAYQLKQQEQVTEQQTLESDILQRKTESRANCLFSEVTECKEALKESEAANLELQVKLDAKLAETDSLKLQLAASEDLMKELQSKVNADDTRARLEQVEAELKAALEDKETLSWLQAQLEEKDLKLQAMEKEKEASVEKTGNELTKYEEDLKAVQLQLAEALQQHQAMLAEQEQLVSSHHEEVLRLETDLKEKSSELQNALSEKEQAEALLASTLDKQTREVQEMYCELNRKSQDLDKIRAEKEQLLSDLDSVKADKETEIQRVQIQLEEKDKEVEQLLSSLASAEVDKETEKQRLQVLLEEKTSEVERIVTEKEQLVSTLNSTEADINEQFLDLQQKLDQRSKECQTLRIEKEDLANRLSNQHFALSKELSDLQESLLQKGQECDILLADNEQLHEELHSISSAYAKESSCLKWDLDQQTHKFDILLSDWDNLEMEFHSRESALKWDLQKIHQRLNETVKELEAARSELVDVKDATDSKDDTIRNLHSEVKQLKEQLTLAETVGDEALQDRQQAVEVLQSQVYELQEELVATKEENDSLLSRLAGQADMFRVKEEEMVTENNALNHQLEEVRNEAQETASQLQHQLDGLQEELQSTRLSLQTQEGELTKLREEGNQQKETLDSLNASNAALVKEKEQLVVRINSLEANVEEIQKELDSQVDALQAEVDRLQQDRDHQQSESDKERMQLHEKNTVLKDQLDSCASEIEQLQQSLKDAVAEQDRLKADRDRLQQQQDAMQLDFSVQLEDAQSQVASKESELQSLQAQLRDSSALLAHQLQSLQEELAAAQAEVARKDSILASATEELTAAKSQLDRLAEEKEMLKNNFDCCMEDMTQRAAENENTIRHLQGRLNEASHNVDRDQGQLREMYESQLSELEDRLAAADLEVQRLEKIADSINAEKEKLKEHLNGQIADLELNIQAAESESSHLREQMSKRGEAHKKEITDLKHSHEIQIMSLEENCQSLEKALAKQDGMMLDVSSRFERDRAEREKAYDQQLSEAYEQVRLHEMDVARVKRQLDEMRKDHQKEQQELQKAMETQIFDLENKCAITMSELERMRQSLWSMEEDHSGEAQSLRNRIQELEALTHNQEKQISDLQDKLLQTSVQSDDNISSLKESYQSEVAHLDGLNQQLSGDVENLQGQLKTMQNTLMQETEALKHEHDREMSIVQEKCRQTESYSLVLQSHMDSVSPGSANDPELVILAAETERLQQELAAAEASIARLQQQLKETQMSYQTKVSELMDQIRTLTSDKHATSTRIEHLTEDLENEKHMLQESQMICQDLEEENKHLTAENSTLRQHAPQPYSAEETESRFVSSEEDRSVIELKQKINHLTRELQRVQMGNDEDHVPMAREHAHFAAEGGFEPEPDTLEYLDLAVGLKASEDYFVEEAEPCKGPPKTRTKSVPSELFVAVEDEQAHILATFQTLQSVSQRVSDNEGLLRETVEDEGGTGTRVRSGDAGRFEPEEESSPPALGGAKGLVSVSEVGPLPPADLVADSFQPESLPLTPCTQGPTAAPILSFLLHPVGVLPETTTEHNFVEAVDSSTQTEDSSKDCPTEDTPDAVVNVMKNQEQPQADEMSGDASQTLQDAKALDENLTDVKRVAEAEYSQRLRSLQDQLEEEWVFKMRSQEVELRHKYDLEFKEFQRKTEHKCQQQIRQVKQESQASFVDAVRKMRKSMKKKQKEEQEQTKALREKLAARSNRSDPGVREGTDDEKLGEIVKQLHEENQELQEVRDVLLEQIAIFQTQGRRHAMQHELQAFISRGSMLSPSQSFRLTSSADSDQAQVAPLSSQVFEPVIQQAEVEPLVASESQALYSSGVVGYEGADAAQENQDDDEPTSQYTPTAGSDVDDDGSEGSSVRDRFLEELEEMSQQSGQDLPLEWELTSTTVAHTSSGGSAGAFERDQTSSGSVWEVFDGRCLRQDCRELESLKRQYEAEMEALRQQLEVQRESSDHVDHQLRSQYMQAVSSLREALQDSEQQKELDAVVGQLQELHQRQLQEVNAQHLHDTALQVTAMRLTVEQVQASRLKLMEEEHHATVQHLNKEHKEQLNALQARLSTANGDGVSPLSASDELTQHYQSLVQRINESLEKEVLERLHGNKNEEDESDEPKTNGFSADIISVQQAEAIQQALQAQQEEVLSMRKRLLQEYEMMLQHRSEGVSQQTEEVQRLQDQMAELQQEYQKQIAEFQARISQYSEEEEQRRIEQQKRDFDLEEVKAKYEQRIADMEQSFSTQISALQQMAAVASTASDSHHGAVDVSDGGDSGRIVEGSSESEPNAESLRLAQERDYVQKTATLTAISDIDSDTTDSPRASAEPEPSSSPSSKLAELQNVLEEKTTCVAELEQCLEEERQKVREMVSQLDSASQKLNDLSSQLAQQKEVSEALQQSLAERDRQLEQALQETAESRKLLQDLTEKEAGVLKEKDELAEQLRQFQEAEGEDRALVTSTPVLEEELKKLRASLEEATAAMQAAETRELELQEKLSEAEHQHTKALEELRQELEHQVQMERETLQSEFQVQLEVELKRQASELEQQFAEQRKGSNSSLQGVADAASTADRTVDDVADSCTPDTPHSGEVVQAALTASQNVSFPSPADLSPDSLENVITEPLLTCQQYQPLQPSVGVEEPENQAGDSAPAVCEDGAVQSSLPTTVSPGADSSSASPSGANAQSPDLVTRQSLEAELRTDSDRQVAELCRQFETERTQLVEAHQERIMELEMLLREAEDKYNKLKEDVEEREGAGVETLVKDRYDMELELAKNLMQKEFDDTLQAEKKKFVERHRKLMDDFMSDRESEAAEIKQKHQQELEDLKSSLSTQYETQITELQAELQQIQDSSTAHLEKSESCKDAEGMEDSDKLNELMRELQEVKEQLQTTSSEHAAAMAALREEYEAKISELKSSHQEELEAAALDTDVLKSELELAHQAEVKRLQEQLLTPAESSQAQGERASEETGALKSTSQSSRDGERTPDVRSSLEYEETDEEGSVHSFSSMLGKTRSFAEVVKSTPPSSPQHSSPQHDQRVKQLEAQVERLTQQLAQQQLPLDSMTVTEAVTTTSPPPSSQAAATAMSPPPHAPTSAAAQADGGDQNLVTMLKSDLDRVSAERDAVQQTNNRLLQLLSDSVHTYVEVEDTINRRLHNVVTASVPRPHSPAHLSRPDNHGDLVTPRGAGLSSFSGVAGDQGLLRGAAAVSSPQSDRSGRPHDADTSSPTLEETSILSNATDEGLDMSQRLTESIFIGPDIDAEGEEIVSDARGRLQNAVSRLLEMIERTTQQLLEAKATQTDLLETMAARTRDNEELTARLHDLEEQVRQEVAAKEYLGLELHKAEGLISGYSSEREALEEQLQSLEEQKEVLASDLETTRSRLQEFQEATGELEARRQDVERQQTLLQENAGQEAQGSHLSPPPSPQSYSFLIVPLGVFVGAYLLRAWMQRNM